MKAASASASASAALRSAARSRTSGSITIVAVRVTSRASEAGDPAVHENGRATRRFFVVSPLPVLVGDHPRAVVVGEHEVVELGEQPYRGGLVGDGRGASFRSKSSRPRSSEAGQLGAEPLEDRAEPGAAEPRLRISDRRRPEGAEVAPHQLSAVRGALAAAPDPALGIGEGRLGVKPQRPPSGTRTSGRLVRTTAAIARTSASG